jgi:hypothetical protein
VGEALHCVAGWRIALDLFGEYVHILCISRRSAEPSAASPTSAAMSHDQNFKHHLDFIDI